MDFTKWSTLLLQLQANDSEQIYYCPRSAIKSSTLATVPEEVIRLNVKSKHLLLFLRVINGNLWEEITTLTTKQKQALVHVLKECGLSMGENQFDGFEVISDAIFESDEHIPWTVWNELAEIHNLDMHQPNHATILLGLRDEALELRKTIKQEHHLVLHRHVHHTENVNWSETHQDKIDRLKMLSLPLSEPFTVANSNNK
jgi:hypothetical protein